MKRILVVFPTEWDHRQLESCRASWQGRYDVRFAKPSDVDCDWDLDLPAYIDRVVDEHAGAIDGVMSSSDYPGATVAAAVATRLGLPGSSPRTVISCSHKHRSRLAQRESVPEATPWFELIKADDPADAVERLRFPCFVKPVKGAFSVLARKVANRDELLGFLAQPVVREFTTTYMYLFNQLVRRFTDFTTDGSYFLAEELLHGRQVTVEGYATDGGVEVLGIVDSEMHPQTGSFTRFAYPTTLERRVVERMADVARRVIGHLGLTGTLWNIEMIHDAVSDRLSIIEINPRICGQFADLYQKVDGISTYELALALAAGDPVRRRPGSGRFGVACSRPLRIFTPSRVASVPDASRLAAAQQSFDDALIWIECVEGQELVDFVTGEDGVSARYGIINLGGADAGDLDDRLRDLESMLGFRFEPITAPTVASDPAWVGDRRVTPDPTAPVSPAM